MEIMEVQDLCKTYGEGEAKVDALKHVSFSFTKGSLRRWSGSLALAKAPS